MTRAQWEVLGGALLLLVLLVGLSLSVYGATRDLHAVGLHDIGVAAGRALRDFQRGFEEGSR